MTCNGGEGCSNGHVLMETFQRSNSGLSSSRELPVNKVLFTLLWAWFWCFKEIKTNVLLISMDEYPFLNINGGGVGKCKGEVEGRDWKKRKEGKLQSGCKIDQY